LEANKYNSFNLCYLLDYAYDDAMIRFLRTRYPELTICCNYPNLIRARYQLPMINIKHLKREDFLLPIDYEIACGNINQIKLILFHYCTTTSRFEAFAPHWAIQLVTEIAKECLFFLQVFLIQNVLSLVYDFYNDWTEDIVGFLTHS